MRKKADIAALLRADPVRWHLLDLVADLGLTDAWIAAGFVRNAVWDNLHDRAPQLPTGDVDVIWFDTDCMAPERDHEIEAQLAARAPEIDWSVKNQARMHLRNGDDPYTSATDAMRHWPETATAIAARRISAESCEIAAPLGIEDLLNGRLCPGPRYKSDRRAIFENRVREKRWLERWPTLRLV